MPPLLRAGGPWDDPGTLGSARKDTLRPRFGFNCSPVDLGSPCLKIVRCLGRKKVYFVMLFPGMFPLVFGFEFGCLGLGHQAFGMRCITKTNSRRCWNSHDSRIQFS